MNNTTHNSATHLASFFPSAIEGLPFHGWASVVLRAVYTYFACAWARTQIMLAGETTPPAGKEVEAVTEKPKRSKLIGTLKSRTHSCNAMEPLPARSPAPFYLPRLQSLVIDLRGREITHLAPAMKKLDA